jgi:hypothetical protein
MLLATMLSTNHNQTIIPTPYRVPQHNQTLVRSRNTWPNHNQTIIPTPGRVPQHNQTVVRNRNVNPQHNQTLVQIFPIVGWVNGGYQSQQHNQTIVRSPFGTSYQHNQTLVGG